MVKSLKAWIAFAEVEACCYSQMEIALVIEHFTGSPRRWLQPP